MSRMLRATALLAVAALVPVAVAFAGGAPTGDELVACQDRVSIGADGWARIKAPTYTAGQGDAVVTAAAVPAGLARRVYVTNGTVVKTSESAGCKWDYIYPPRPAVAVPSEAYRTVVTHLAAPSDTTLWLAMYDEAGAVTQPHVAMTRDATYAPGNTTKEPIAYVDDGLPAAGRPLALAVPRMRDRAFLLVEEPHDPDSDVTAPTKHVYRLTVDDQLEPVTGAPRYLWQEGTLPPALRDAAGLVASPRQTDTVWAWAGRTYGWSGDGGVTWRTGTAPGRVTTIDVDDTGTASVFSEAADGGLLERVAYQDGSVLQRLATPVRVRTAAHGYTTGVVTVNGDGRTFGYDTLGRTWVDVTPRGGAAFDAVYFGTASSGDRIVLGQTRDTLFRLDLFPDESFVQRDPGEIVGPGPGGGKGGGVPTLTPPYQAVTVRPGERARARLRLNLPPSAGRIDVFFLIDTTSSMNAAIKGLRDGVRKIADEVSTRTRGQACFGVGEVKDFSVADNPWYGAAAVTPYKLQKPITCDLDELSEGLDALHEGGGDRYPEESQALGLVQAVTGSGAPTLGVLPGQDAGFVAPTRVVVLITDAGFKLAPQFPDYPTMDETVATLTKFGHETNVVSVLLQTRNALGPAVVDATEVARRTKTFAPRGGVDCDGDGRVDVRAGAPLVCKAENYAPSIAPAIVGLLLGVKEPAPAGMQVEDPHEVVVGMAGAFGPVRPAKRITRIVNIRVPNTVRARLVVTCRRDQDGQDLPVRVVGTRRQVGVAEATVLVRCRALPRHPVLRPPPPKVPPEPLPQPPDDRVRPVLVPALLPPVQPPVNNPPPNMNVNAGFSQQEEEQYQVAAVTQDAEEDGDMEEVELAMSRVDPDAAAARLVLGCAVLTAAGGAVAVGYRRRTQHALRTAPARRGT